MLILHIRPGHKGAVVISLPRDSEVPIMACKPDGLGDPGQQAAPGQTEMLNATFAFGGPVCLWKTVENLAGIRIDHYVGLTFTGFEKIINDIGGVNVCLPEAIHDPKSGLDLSAGKHHVLGVQALAFWRERYVGEGSDLQRIQRQQYLMAGLVQELKTGGLLSDYPKLYGVIRDAAKALTVDQGLSLSDMVSLAGDLRSLSTKSVQFVTVPNYPDPTNQDRVLWLQPQAKRLFRAIAHDEAIPKTKPTPASTSTPSTVATTSPGNVQVEVLNGNGVPGAAGAGGRRPDQQGLPRGRGQQCEQFQLHRQRHRVLLLDRHVHGEHAQGAAQLGAGAAGAQPRAGHHRPDRRIAIHRAEGLTLAGLVFVVRLVLVVVQGREPGQVLRRPQGKHQHLQGPHRLRRPGQPGERHLTAGRPRTRRALRKCLSPPLAGRPGASHGAGRRWRSAARPKVPQDRCNSRTWWPGPA